MPVNKFGIRSGGGCQCDGAASGRGVSTAYVDQQDAMRVLKAGDTMGGNLDTGSHQVTWLPTGLPGSNSDATRWQQVENLVTDATTNNGMVPAGPLYLTNKQYVDDQDALRVLKAGDTMTGDLRLNVGTDAVRLVGCTDLSSGKGFSLALGNIQNQPQFAVVAPPQTQIPVTMEPTREFLVRSAGQDVCQLGNTDAPPIIIIHKNIVMNGHRIVYLSEPSNSQDAATKNYVDSHKPLITVRAEENASIGSGA